MDALPEKVAVIGGGYIGLELGIALRRLGSEVTVIEGMDKVLAIFDDELRRPLTTWLRKNGVITHVNCLAQGAEVKDVKVVLTWKDTDGEMQSETFDKVLVTVGRRPNTRGWGLEKMGLRMDADERFIRIDDQCKTSMRGVYAIGDVSGEPMLAHRASAQGEMVAEIIAGHKRAFDPVAIPAIVFTEPEIICVGLTPDEAKDAGEEIIIGKFPLAANGRPRGAAPGAAEDIRERRAGGGGTGPRGG